MRALRGVTGAALSVVLLGAAASAQSTAAGAQSAAAVNWPQQRAAFFRQMARGRSEAALATAQALCAAHPNWPLPFTFRGLAEAKLGRWRQARADFAIARSQDLLPQYRWLWALALMHSPRPADRAAAVADASAALRAKQTFSARLGTEEILVRALSPSAFLAQLRAAPPLPPARQWQAVAAYALHLIFPHAEEGYVAGPLWGISRGVRWVAVPEGAWTHATSVAAWFAQAQRALGNAAELEADWVQWLVYRGRLAAAAQRWHAAQAQFPGDVLLAEAGERLQLEQARVWMDQGFPRRVLAALSSAPASPAVGVLRARALASEGQYTAAEQAIMEAVLRGEPPGGGVPANFDSGLRAAHGDVLTFDLARASAAAADRRFRDLYFWQGWIAFAAGDYSAAAAAFAASPGLKIGLHPLPEAMRALSLDRSGHPHQAAALWADIAHATGQGLSPVYLDLRSAQAARQPVGIQGELTRVLCRRGQPTGIEIQDGLLRFPLRVARPVRGVPRRCGPLPQPVWGVAMAIPDGNLLPSYIGTLRRWLPQAEN